MTTVINNPGDNGPVETVQGQSAMSAGSGVIIGACIVILVLGAAIFFSLPYLRSQINSMTHPGNPTINNPTIKLEVPLPSIPKSMIPSQSSSTNSSTTP